MPHKWGSENNPFRLICNCYKVFSFRKHFHFLGDRNPEHNIHVVINITWVSWICVYYEILIWLYWYYQVSNHHCLLNSNINSVILIILVECRVSWKGNEYWQPYFLLYSKKGVYERSDVPWNPSIKFLLKSKKKKFREKN